MHLWCVSATQLWFQQYLRRAGGFQLKLKPVHRSREACVRPKRDQRPQLCHDYNLTLAVSRKQINPDIFRWIYNITTTLSCTPSCLGYWTHHYVLFCFVPTVPTGGAETTFFVQQLLVFMLRIHISLISGNPLKIGVVKHFLGWKLGVALSISAHSF